MPSYLFLIGGLFLGWVFGRNNLSHLFGAAVFTRMVRFKTAVWCAAVCVCLGAIFAGADTTSVVSQLGQPETLMDVFIMCVSVAVVFNRLTKWGIPISTTQGMIGAIVAYGLFHGTFNQSHLLYQMVGAWIYTPFLSAILSFCVFKTARLFLKYRPIPLLYKDVFVRIGLIGVGMFSAYALGANNIGTITAPYLHASGFNPVLMTSFICLSVAVGFFTADKKVIRTMGTGLYPLSPVEALIVCLSTSVTLFLFSWSGLKDFLTVYGLPSFPLVPIPMTCVVIGSIIGVSYAKGGHGLKYNMLGNIILSWVSAPLLSGALCWIMMLGISGWGNR